MNALVNTDTQRLCCCWMYVTQELKRPSLVPAPCMWLCLAWLFSSLAHCWNDGEWTWLHILFVISDKLRENSLPYLSELQTQGWTVCLRKALCPKLKFHCSRTWDGYRRKGWVGINNVCSACAMARTSVLWEAGIPIRGCITRCCSLLPNQAKFGCTAC